MIILDTVPHDTVWGGQRLLPYVRGEYEKIGHLYSLCCEKGLENHILNGPYKGCVFQDYFLDARERFGLGQYREFPLIVALVEAKDDLSIQVHPGDEMAVREEGSQYGKNESWYFLEGPDSGYIYNGCLAVDADELRQKLACGGLMSVVGRLPVSSGDYVYVEAGTLHALTAGSLLYEIEENSPWTYRLYDYGRCGEDGRPRKLHVDKALRALRFDRKSKAVCMGNEERTERRYSIKKLENVTEYVNQSGTLECLTMIKGNVCAQEISVGPGMTVVLEPGETLRGRLALAMMARPR